MSNPVPDSQNTSALRAPSGPRFSPVHWSLRQYKELIAAVRFLTTIPIPGSAQLFRTDESEQPELIIGSAYFPLVGLLLSLLLWLLLLLIGPFLPSLALAALLVVALICLTGGLHLDGLMDSCDGLFGGGGRERKLEIMHDSRVGSFGVLGGASILLLKFALFASLNTHQLPLALLLLLPGARWTMVLAMYNFPGARGGGLGAVVRQTVTRGKLLFAGTSSLLITLSVGRLLGLSVWVLTSLIALLIGLRVKHVLGGLTGDIYGAIAEVSEVGGLLLLVLAHTYF